MKINARIATLLLLGAGLAAPALAQKGRLKKTPNISLNISTRKDSVKTTCLNVGLLTNIHRLQGAGINAVSSVVQTDMAGLQLSGLANITGRNASGVQFAGIANVAGRNANGVALGGLMNVAGNSANGMQIGGLANIAGNSSRGITVGGLLNVAGNRAQGLQIGGLANVAGNAQNGVAIAGLMNVAGEEMNGIQVASILNVSGGETKGAQVAIGNVGVSVNGAQIGVLNVCHKIKGVQIGIVNYSKDSTAHKVGLVNIDPRTRTQLLLFAGNASKLNAAVRFKNRRTYSMLGLGTHYLGLDDKFSGCVFYRTGLHYPLARNVEISGDLGYFHIENFHNEDAETPERMYSLQARVNLECRLAPKLSLFASGGYGVTRHYDRDKCYEKKAIVELGVVLF